MKLDRLYHQSVRILQPSRAEMKRRHAPFIAADNAARAEVLAELQAGADAKALYDIECAKRRADPEAPRFRSVALLGVLRRGINSLTKEG